MSQSKLAFTLGVVPLVIASGASVASQTAVVTAVLGGMISATILAIIFVPYFFVFVLKLMRTKRQVGDDVAEDTPKSATSTHS